MRRLLAGIAVALVLTTTGHAQTRKVIAPKAVASPTTAMVKVAPRVLPADAILSTESTAEQRAYSDLVDHVSKTMDDFADDNTSGNAGRDHIGDPPAKESKDNSEARTPATTKTTTPWR